MNASQKFEAFPTIRRPQTHSKRAQGLTNERVF